MQHKVPISLSQITYKTPLSPDLICASEELTSSRDHFTLHGVFLSLLFSLLSGSVECSSSSSSLLKNTQGKCGKGVKEKQILLM